MKKNQFFIIIAIVISFTFSGCMWNGGRVLTVSEDKIADARFEQIMKAISEKDTNTIKTIFSKKVTEESPEIEERSVYLFNIFQGKVQKWEQVKWTSGETIEHGKKSIKIVSWYSIETDQSKYLAFIIDYPKDTIDPSNQGLYALRIIRAEDKETEFTKYWQDMEIAGIYKPKQ